MKQNDVTQKDSIFAKLKKLFSDEVIIRNVGGKDIKIADTESGQFATDRNSLRDRFNRLRSSAYGLHSRDMAMSYQSARLELFRDYDVMDMHSMISSALDIYADEIVTQNEFGKVLTISTEDDKIKRTLENLFYDIMNVEFNLWSWVRNLCKYGDFYLLMDISPEYGIYNVHPLSAYEITRVEGTDPENKSYVKFQHDGAYGGQEYENFEVSHFRLLSDSNFLPYGRSMLEGSRRVWKQYNLMVDAMLIHRIMRAPEKRIFKIDIGNIDPNEVDSYMEKLIGKMKKVPYMDEKTGDYNLRFNLQNMVEDYFLPVRGSDSGTSIDTLGGMEYTGIDDIEFLKNELLAGLKIPKAFLTYDEAIGGKSVLNQEDIRFAKTVGRLQKMVISELNKIAIVHLYVQGYRDASLLNFKLELTNPSAVLEQEKISLWQDKLTLAKDMHDSKLFDTEYIYREVFKLSSQQIAKIKKGVISDQKDIWRVAQIEESGNDPAMSRQSVESDGSLKDISDEESSDGAGESDGGEDFSNSELENLPPLKEESSEERVLPDQSGIKDASDYPFGENPLGAYEDEGSRTDPIRHKHRGGVLSIRESELKHILKRVNEKAGKYTTKTLLSEEVTRSMLDESQIIQEE
jgi:hypothetical protein